MCWIYRKAAKAVLRSVSSGSDRWNGSSDAVGLLPFAVTCSSLSCVLIGPVGCRVSSVLCWIWHKTEDTEVSFLSLLKPFHAGWTWHFLCWSDLIDLHVVSYLFGTLTWVFLMIKIWKSLNILQEDFVVKRKQMFLDVVGRNCITKKRFKRLSDCRYFFNKVISKNTIAI